MDIVGIEDDISTYFFEPFNLNPELGILHFTRYRVILKKLLKEMCDFLFYEHFLTNVCTLGEIGLLNVTQKCSTHNKFLPNFIVQVGALWLQLLKNELHFCNSDKFNPNATNFNPIDTRSPIVQWVRAIRNIFRVRIEHLLKRFFKQPVWNGEDGNFYVKSRILLFKVMTRSTLQPLSVSFFKC